ncbi:hypothetical protein BKA56DRAFT_625397 [Ilyonectria sp. MPI-CAGE-AT-0026]|nr:hypothetical protein BKA56DRAFT_625397 [Ilyonectria sp. MPI-CAGE-AT-0026]
MTLKRSKNEQAPKLSVNELDRNWVACILEIRAADEPSNYEQQNSSQKTLQQPWSGSLSSNTTRGSQMSLRTTDQSPLEIPESEVRHRLQQYKRDIIFQASKAASDLTRGSAISDKKLGDGMSLSGIPIPDIRFAAPALHKPSSPRLLPVDSPGPVTPMDLECISGGGSLDR